MADWYCKIMGDTFGPMSTEELRTMATDGRLGENDYVMKEGTSWVPADTVKGLFLPTTKRAVGQPSPAALKGPSFNCPFCKTDQLPIVKSKVTGVGWVIFVVLLLSCVTSPFCFIGLLIREQERTCRACGMKLG